MTIILVSALISASVTSLVWVVTLLQRRMGAVEDRLAKIDQQQDELKSCKGKRHYSHNQVAAIWDAMSVILSAKSDNEAERARMDTALGILSVLYANPHSYDPERPSTPRS